ncbi:MAG: hypothetical protein ABEI31_07100 [Halodesulfurarchaeum sp.]
MTEPEDSTAGPEDDRVVDEPAGETDRPPEEREDLPPEATAGPNVEAMQVWDRVVADMEVTAEELGEEGWDTLELHPGDVTVIQDDPEPGVDVLLADNEFDALQGFVEGDVDFDEYEVFRAGGEDVEYALVVAKDRTQKGAILIPLYYQVRDLAAALERSPEQIAVFLRRLDDETYQLSLAEPDLLLPEEAAGE